MIIFVIVIQMSVLYGLSEARKAIGTEVIESNSGLFHAICDISLAMDLLAEISEKFKRSASNTLYINERPSNDLPYHFDKYEFARAFELVWDAFENNEALENLMSTPDENTKISYQICIYGIKVTSRLMKLTKQYIERKQKKIRKYKLLEEWDKKIITLRGPILDHIKNIDYHDLSLVITYSLIVIRYDIKSVYIEKFNSVYDYTYVDTEEEEGESYGIIYDQYGNIEEII